MLCHSTGCLGLTKRQAPGSALDGHPACAGSQVVYSWAFAQGSPQFVAPFVASRKDLVISGTSGVVGAIAGTTYDLELTTNLLVRHVRA